MNKFKRMEKVKKTSWKCDESRVDSLFVTSGRLESQCEGISVILAVIKDTNNKIDQNHTDISVKLEANTSTLVKLQ